MSRIVLNLRPRRAGPNNVIFNQKIDPETRELLDQQIRKEKEERERKEQEALKPSHPVLFRERIRFRQKPDKKVYEQPIQVGEAVRQACTARTRTADLRDFAASELSALGSDPMDRAMRDHVMQLIEVFRAEGHSGFSAATASRMFDRLSRFKPIRPLTGADDEWNAIAADMVGRPGLFQNRRCPSVFKDETGAYDIDATVCEDPDGVRYTNRQSRRPVQFPYEVPDGPVVIRVDRDGRPVANVAHARQLVAVARRLLGAATTFQAARSAILDDLQRRGWKVVSGLKIPHATSPHGQLRLWFKAQAVYFTEDLSARSDRNGHTFGHARTISYDLDIRTLTPDEFYAYLKRAFPEALKFETRDDG